MWRRIQQQNSDHVKQTLLKEYVFHTELEISYFYHRNTEY